MIRWVLGIFIAFAIARQQQNTIRASLQPLLIALGARQISSVFGDRLSLTPRFSGVWCGQDSRKPF
jgi:hypothetical protein